MAQSPMMPWQQRARLVICLALPLVLGQGSGSPAATWRQTISLSREQQTLTQKMSAEALMVLKDIDPAANRQQLAAEIRQFDVNLGALTTGNQEILPPTVPAQQVLQQVSSAWQPLNSTLTALLSAAIDASTWVPALQSQNLVLYSKLNELTDLYVSAGVVANGTSSDDRRMDLLQRQQALIYKIWKEAFLLSYSAEATENLLQTKMLFTSTHRGIIEGARWLDMPQLSQVCALSAMTDVTYNLEKLDQLLLSISGAAAPADVANELAVNISQTSTSLSAAMANALTFIVDPTCNEPQLTDLEWFNALTTAEDQLLQASKATQLFLQVALEYKVAESKVQLTLLSDDATSNLRDLLEGNKARGLTAPPIQSLVQKIIGVKEVWDAMTFEFSKAISAASVGISSVSEIVRLTKLFTDQMEDAVSLYVTTAIAAGTSIPAYTLDLASRQRTKAQKLAKEASIVNLGYSVPENWAAYNATTQLLVDTHWKLLEGAPAMAPYPAVNATSDLCIIQQMWRALDTYEDLLGAANQVLAGSRSLSRMETYTQQFDEEMDVAVEWYKAQGTISCAPFNVSLYYWRGLIRELGNFRFLTQDLVSDFLLLDLNMSNPDTITQGRATLDLSARRLRFGSEFVPPPPVQSLLETFSAQLLPAITALHSALDAEDVALIFSASSALLREADGFLETFFVEGRAQEVEAPLHRMNLASRQIVLAKKMFRDYVLLSGNSSAQTSLAESIATFYDVHQSLRDGGMGIAKLSLVRQDALKQWERIGQAFASYRERLDQRPDLGNRPELVGQAYEALKILVAELEIGVEMFGIPDEEMQGEVLWPIIAYSAFIFCMLTCVCAAIYSVRRHYAQRAQWSDDATNKV